MHQTEVEPERDERTTERQKIKRRKKKKSKARIEIESKRKEKARQNGSDICLHQKVNIRVEFAIEKVERICVKLEIVIEIDCIQLVFRFCSVLF